MESTSPQGAIIPHRLEFECDKGRPKTIGMIESMQWSSRQLFLSRAFGTFVGTKVQLLTR